MITANEIIAILLWLVIVAALFVLISPRRAVIAGFVGGWLFLPILSIPIPSILPNLTKSSITSLGILGAVIFFDHPRLFSLRPRWFDLPILVWCLSPLLTALVNGEGIYEGISAILQNSIVWGIPYTLGRLYIQDATGWRELAIAIFFGGLIYVPLCWFEIFAGPQLARLIYGFTPQAVDTAFRFGGWRPVVFMEHGLMVALWMTAASVSGFWLWRTGTLPHVWRIPTQVLVPALCLTTIALKSVNGWVLLAFGISILWLVPRWGIAWLLWAALAVILVYVGIRASGAWNGQGLGELTLNALGDKPGSSVTFRMQNEQLIAERARQKIILGWGRGGQIYLPDAPGNSPAVPDSLWIIAFAQQGILGLAALFALLLLPMIFLLRRVPGANWSRAEFAPAAALAIILVIYTIDNLANAMLNPIYLLAAGGLLTLPGVIAANAAAKPGKALESAPQAPQIRGT